ncbi:MAG: RNA methyltransferase [Bacteroidales bacterium]|nr:RNA methyltransferase [Bacteroidales bacterium]
MEEPITSARNPRIKELLSLREKSRLRRESGLFVVEGAREFVRALRCGFVARSVFYCSQYLKDNSIAAYIDSCGGTPFEVSEDVYDRIALREGAEGVVAILKERRSTLEEITFKGAPLVIVLESVEKPGNIGAVLRTADAAGADAVIVCDPRTDLFNPNLIRASLGSAFSVRTVACTSEEAAAWLKANNISILTAQLQDSKPYYDTDMTRGVAIVMGTEDEGLSDFWRERSDAKIRIPMNGLMDSLNVSVSAAILCFEAVRQRDSGK